MKSEQIKAITEKATAQLVAALDAGHSETLNAYLKAIGRFHRYSLHNVMLIASQKPNASYVAGFRTWNELGRFVKKGEKGLMIQFHSSYISPGPASPWESYSPIRQSACHLLADTLSLDSIRDISAKRLKAQNQWRNFYYAAQW
jgi:hypothetical protein